ncbi:hypothetical protein O6H91_16G058700 [Diphasiastrum complanatum]|uniref:Uncharacterized protein n=3 Tax=Diphasiastrum complanatum TaxID=34168 RepID=A0ACC2BCL0_DIPCM|nr:hypothetical protein O6H91_Y579600 [Diphasiastrum complanatum]KAJ7298454.1 hypothetical protein O6H91_Y579600 [Diphasiastrum complanatum]KAJ7527509.1 hypothetical protein O6H91_16G058700 [Diphasiastrum complanatum]KAJ7527510.1 hypothetical protein O6H91_16G058700 [Diphasiastrum complanatum]KAJ7527511.1 hypothetical protein O6H91_16G058700 [Diphasiastrum complanatum]
MADYQHSVEEQLPDIEYCPNDSPSWPETIVLAFQHYVTMLGTTVLIPTMLVYQMGGDNRDKVRVIQTLLFVNGLNTLLQTLFGTRLPVVMGGSYAFLISTMSIINSPALQAIYDDRERFLRTMREIQGALIVASSIQIILGFSGLWGILLKFITPLALAPVVALVGLGLYIYGFPGVAKCVEVGIPELILLVIFSQYLKIVRTRRISPFERFPIIFSIIPVWVYAHILTVGGAYKHASYKGKIHCRTDRAHLVDAAPWVRLPYPLEWGAPTFNAGHAFAMMAAALVAQIESTAAFYGVSRVANATPPPTFVVGRGVGWQGIGTLMDGLFGTLSGSTVSIENAGLIGITRVGSRRTVQIAAIFMIFFSVFGKFGGILASIPQPIFAAIFCVLDGVFAAVGISLLQFTNLNLTRNLFVLGFTLFMGFSVPRYFMEFEIVSGHGPVHTGATWFNDILNTIFSSNAVVAFIVAVFLDNTLIDRATKKDRGMTWWRRFHKWRGSPTNEEFYKLPFNLNKYFPPPQI